MDTHSVTSASPDQAPHEPPLPVQAPIAPTHRGSHPAWLWGLWVFLSYLVLAGAILYPASIHLSTWVAGGGELGGWLWRFWLMKLELAALRAELPGQWVEFFLQMISLGRFPETGNIADLYLILWPLDALFGLTTAQNLKLWLILLTNALAGYALARHFTARAWLAWAVGGVAASNPFVLHELYETGPRQALLCWVLLGALFLERMLKRPRGWDALLGGLTMGLLAAFYWFYALFFGLYGAARVASVWAPALWRSPWLRQRLGRRPDAASLPTRGLESPAWQRWGPPVLSWLLMAGLALWIAWVFSWPYRVLKTDHTGALPEVQWFTAFPSLEALQNAPQRPATLEENLLSSLARVLKSSWQLDYLWNPAHPRAVPLVIGVLALGLAVVRLRREGFFLLVALFFWLHTGGPYLQDFGLDRAQQYLRWEGAPIRLPYAWTFQYVPMMSRLFAPYRSGAFFWLAVLILLVRNLDWGVRQLELWLSRWTLVPAAGSPDGSARARSLNGAVATWLRTEGLAAGVALGVTFLALGQGFLDRSTAQARGLTGQELLRRGIPVVSSPLQVHPFYETLARSPEQSGVIEVPLHVQQDLINYYQVIHQKKLLRGWAVPGALPPSLRFRQTSRHPETQKLLWLTGPDTPMRNTFAEALDGLNAPPYNLGPFDPADLQALAARGFRTLILHERGCAMLWPARGAELYQALRRRLGLVLGEGREEIELIREGDPRYGTVDAGYLGDWLRSELAGEHFNATRFHMTLFSLQAAEGSSAGAGADQHPPEGGTQGGGSTAPLQPWSQRGAGTGTSSP